MQIFSYNQLKHYIFWTNFSGCISLFVKKMGVDYRIKLIKQAFENDVFTREIVIYFNDLPCLYCTTTCDEKTYNKFKLSLDNLQNKPIGENLLYHKDYNWKKKINIFFLNQYKSHKVTLKRVDNFELENFNINIKQYFTPNLIKAFR